MNDLKLISIKLMYMCGISELVHGFIQKLLQMKEMNMSATYSKHLL